MRVSSVMRGERWMNRWHWWPKWLYWENGVIAVVITAIFALLLATSVPVQAQWVNYPKTIRLYNNATGESLGTVTVSEGKAYFRDKDGVHYATTVRDFDGKLMSFDTNGNVIAPLKVPE
jgi:hypothetical protein